MTVATVSLSTSKVLVFASLAQELSKVVFRPD